ncbi:hypothetical protein GmHk_18G051362 [Glycine max]|nr:hypothetical protein GmHk_18G051362 [Glycine max]
MYDHLNHACRSGGRQLVGYITLLQIYEHFPLVAECMVDPDYDDVSPRACRWIATKASLKSISTSTYSQCLDGLRIPNVCWMPYGEHRPVREFDLISCFSGPVAIKHRPERVMHQFGYMQSIPAEAIDSWLSFEEIDNRWMHYSDHFAPTG